MAKFSQARWRDYAIQSKGQTMNSRLIFQLGLLSAAACLSSVPLRAADAPHKFIVTDSSAARAQLPFSDAVQAGDTLYVSGTLGIDPATSQVATDPKAEAKLVLDAVKHTVEASGYQFEDLVFVQVYCTNLELYGLFNDVYRTYFHEHFPTRAFIGVNQLVRGAHFEVMATAVKSTRAH
jgi:reactive intermediate/imine deaminase